jgi:hypothetical protein
VVLAGRRVEVQLGAQFISACAVHPVESRVVGAVEQYLA